MAETDSGIPGVPGMQFLIKNILYYDSIKIFFFKVLLYSVCIS